MLFYRGKLGQYLETNKRGQFSRLECGFETVKPPGEGGGGTGTSTAMTYNFQVKKGKVCGLRTGRVVRDLVAGKFVDGFCVQRVLFERPLTPPWTLLP